MAIQGWVLRDGGGDGNWGLGFVVVVAVDWGVALVRVVVGD